MNAPTTAPALPDAALPPAIDYAVKAYRDAIGTTISALTSVSGADRDLVVTLEDEEARALAYIGIAVRAVVAAADAAGAERGRAGALAEVDAACERIVKDKHGVGVDGMVALYGFQRGDDGPTEWGEALCEVDEPTPTAALFVAAAAATAAALTPGGAS